MSRGYDSEPLRKLLRWLGILPELAARNTDHGSGMGKTRWVVERTNAFLHGCVAASPNANMLSSSSPAR